MLFAILLTVQILVSVSMAGLILIQRSEGGALGMGGGPSGFMSARGAGNLLTKATAILAFIFFANCIGLTIVSNYSQRAVSAVDKVDTSGLTVTPSTQPVAPAASQSSSSVPSLSDLPLDSGTPASSTAAPSLTPLAPASTSVSSAAKPVAQKPAAAKPAASSAASPSSANSSAVTSSAAQ